VYLLAFDVKDGNPVDPLDPRIIYTGETCRELAWRWRYFDYAARGKDAPHTGGRAFRRRVKRPLSDLFLAAWGAEIQDPILRSAYIRYVERKLILEWVRAHGRLPCLNQE
jgi:hypothetical protein